MRRLALIAAVAVAAGCGGSTIDGGALEDEIKEDASAEGLVVDEVDCPSPEAETGDTFECTVTVKGEDKPLEVVQQNDDGNVTYNLGPLLEGTAGTDEGGDETSIRFVIDAVNKDVTALCDYATAEYRKELAKDENCAKAVLDEYDSAARGLRGVGRRRRGRGQRRRSHGHARAPEGWLVADHRRSVEISHPDKELFPGITKRDLADYYERVGRIMVRHVRDRPVAMQAFPSGIEAEGHYMKDRPKHFPDWIPDVRVAKRGGSLRHVLIRETSALVYLAGQNVITPHVWMSRADDVRKPDRIVFDLDPSTQKFAEVRAAARATGDMLRELGLAPHAMVTGSRGIHVTVPIKPVPFEEAFAFAKAVATAARRGEPEEADDRVPQGETRRPDLRGRAAQPLRAARGPAVRGAAAPRGARSRAAALGRARPMRSSSRTAGRSRRCRSGSRNRTPGTG